MSSEYGSRNEKWVQNFAVVEVPEELEFEERDAVCFSLFGTPPSERVLDKQDLTPKTGSFRGAWPIAFRQNDSVSETQEPKETQSYKVPHLDLEDLPSEVISKPNRGAKGDKAVEMTPMTAVSFGEERFGGAEGQRCSCKKSQCVRLHCACFKNGGYCGPDCGCLDCVNQSQFEAARSFVIKKTLEINPQAFTSKIKSLGSSEQLVNSQGCNCSRNGCKKNYCDCFKSGVGCSSLCRCEGCLNGKRELAEKEVAQVGKRISRKKHKIVIGSRIALDNEPSFCTRAIVYVPHSKKIKKNQTSAVGVPLEI